MDREPMRDDEPAFIFGCHKSGTSLLRSLLDHHPQLSVLPRETHFFQIAGYWIDYGLKRSYPGQHGRKDIHGEMFRFVERQNHDRSSYSDNPGFEGYDLNRFSNCFKGAIPKEHKELFRKYMEALYYASNGIHIPEGTRIVEKTVEHLEYAGLIRKYFPGSPFIHIVRNPYATLVATRRSRNREQYPKMRRIASSLYNSSYFLFKNVLEFNNYFVLRYEDLVTDPEDVMRKVSGFLGIKYDEILVRPTSNGRAWTSNTTGGTTFNGISKAPLEIWKENINGFEIELVNEIAGPVIERFGYERLEPRRSGYWPVKGETPLTYFQNRMLLSMWKP